MSFAKKLKENIDAEFHGLLPDDKILNEPKFKYYDE